MRQVSLRRLCNMQHDGPLPPAHLTAHTTSPSSFIRAGVSPIAIARQQRHDACVAALAAAGATLAATNIPRSGTSLDCASRQRPSRGGCPSSTCPHLQNAREASRTLGSTFIPHERVTVVSWPTHVMMQGRLMCAAAREHRAAPIVPMSKGFHRWSPAATAPSAASSTTSASAAARTAGVSQARAAAARC